MARRSDHTREELRNLAIAAGQKIISENGFATFSARKVAKEIGYTVGTIYNIFDSHDDLILHINAATLDDIGVYFTNHSDTDLDGKEAIKQLATCYLEFAKRHYNCWSALFEHSMEPNTILPNWYNEKLERLFVKVEKPLLPLVNNHKKRAQQAAKTIWASIHGVCALGLTGKLDVVGADSVQILVDNLVDHYIVGLIYDQK